MAQMLALVAVGAGNAEIIIVIIREPLGNGGKCPEPIFCDPDLSRSCLLGLLHFLGILIRSNLRMVLEGLQEGIQENAEKKPRKKRLLKKREESAGEKI